jgi:dTDP-4-dehydrorhamnose reductase
MAVNAIAPGILAEEAQRLGSALVHYSTDYVFDGAGTAAWREADPTRPLNAYGRSKLAGEAAIQATGVPHLILRTSWVHGAHGNNFIKTMLRLARERTRLQIVHDQVGAPTSARVIADVTSRILLAIGQRDPADFAALLRERGGLLHLACAGETSWYDFALQILRQARARGTPLAVEEVIPIASHEYQTAAVRPKNSRLDCSELFARFGIAVPDWKVGLQHTLDGFPGQAERATKLPVAARANLACHEEQSSPRVADLDVGVIYTHEHEWMPRLLSTLQPSGEGLNLRLILVDNHSSDGVAQWESYVPQTTVLRNSMRLGYARNLNRILQASRAPLVLLLNTDMEFDPPEQCLAKMVRFMRQHPDCGISGCRLYHLDGTYGYPARRFQTWRTIAGRRTPLAPFFGRAVDEYLYADRDETDVYQCDWLSGCFMLVRRQAYEQVGGLDCGFEKYFEDVDLCLRMARAGWRVMFNGATYCYHGEERASRKLFSRDAAVHLKSYYRWLRKWGWSPQKSLATRQVA